MIKTKILAKKSLYSGFTQLYEYNLEIASLNPQKQYLQPCTREILHCYDAVVVLIYAPEIDCFVLCKEFRVGVFCNENNNDEPYIFECVAGMIDENKSPIDTAKQEVYEETGLKVNKLQQIAKVYSSPGHLTEKIYIYYAEIAGIPQNGFYGLAAASEEIETHIIKREEVYKMMDEMQILDSQSLLALNWFRVKNK